jgi:adenylate cyclase
VSRQVKRALRDNKREGLAMALRARLGALAAVAVFLPFVVPWPAVIFPELFALAFALVGYAQHRFARIDHSRLELFLGFCLFCDIVLMTLIVILPNPFDTRILPAPVHFRFGTFIYFFIFLAGATISLGWRTLLSMAIWAPLVWLAGAGVVWLTYRPPPDAGSSWLLPDRPSLQVLLDPGNILWEQRIQEAVVFAIVVVILVANARRAERLLRRFAESERERANLSRYFSPNVVEELATTDQSIGRPRVLSAAVLFVDIVGFTRYAASVTPGEAMVTLQAFFARMERAVFEHRGTLDKYLGDGLMATFGTPAPGKCDALDAIRCARAMLAAVGELNTERRRAGLPPLRIGLGAHYGEVILGNIGVDRLEFAVIGDSVNVASRLESLTRQLGVALVVSEALLAQARSEAAPDDPALAGIEPAGTQPISGTAETIAIATLAGS